MTSLNIMSKLHPLLHIGPVSCLSGIILSLIWQGSWVVLGIEGRLAFFLAVLLINID